MSTPLSLTTAHRPDGTPVLTAAGEVDMTNAAQFAEALARAATTTAGPLVVDLTSLEYLDSAGLAALFPHAERLHLIAGPMLAPVLTIAGLSDILTVNPS